jgi:ketosteroid isomerase-like protein
MKAINAAFNSRDVDRIVSFFADDATFLMARGPEPCGRRVHGKAAIRKVLADRFAVIAGLRWDHIDHFVTGNRAVSVWTVTGTGGDGEALNYQGCDIYEFRGDKILNKDTYWKMVEQRERLSPHGRVGRAPLASMGPAGAPSDRALSNVQAKGARWLPSPRLASSVSESWASRCAGTWLANPAAPWSPSTGVGSRWRHWRGRRAVASSVADVAERAQIIFLSCRGTEVRASAWARGLAAGSGPPRGRGHQHLPRRAGPELERAFAPRRGFADAPVARTAQAARDGTSASWWAATPPVRAARPLLACIGSEITHCGAVGAGQAVKLMNNMVVAQTVVALAEALAVARASGAVDPKVLFETLTKGSADSFVLRNQGKKSLLPDHHPTQGAFPTNYIIKDLSYAIGLAEAAGLTLEQASTTLRLMERTKALGFADNTTPPSSTPSHAAEVSGTRAERGGHHGGGGGLRRRQTTRGGA